MPEAHLSFLHISDLHIVAEEERRQHGADTAAILRQAIPMMNALRPDFIVASGDLISDESEESYRRAADPASARGGPDPFPDGQPR